MIAQRVGLPRRAPRGNCVSVSAFLVRPYTTRKGDTLESIAEKRGVWNRSVLCGGICTCWSCVGHEVEYQLC